MDAATAFIIDSDYVSEALNLAKALFGFVSAIKLTTPTLALGTAIRSYECGALATDLGSDPLPDQNPRVATDFFLLSRKTKVWIQDGQEAAAALQKLRHLLQPLLTPQPEIDPQELLRACGWCTDAQASEDRQRSLLFACIGIESLLGDRDAKSAARGLTDKISDRLVYSLEK